MLPGEVGSNLTHGIVLAILSDDLVRCEQCYMKTHTAQDTIYRIAGNFRQGKISADLFSRTRDWAKLNSRALNFNLTLSTLHFSKSSSSWLR